MLRRLCSRGFWRVHTLDTEFDRLRRGGALYLRQLLGLGTAAALPGRRRADGVLYASITLPVILLVLWLDRGPLVSVLLCVLWGVAQSIQMFGGLYVMSASAAGSAETVSLSSPILWTFPVLVFRWFPGFAATGQLVLPQKEAPFYLDTLPLLALCLLLMAVCGALMVRFGRRQEV